MPETELLWLVEKYWTDFHQTYANDALWGRDEWGSKGERSRSRSIAYAGNSTGKAERIQY